MSPETLAKFQTLDALIRQDVVVYTPNGAFAGTLWQNGLAFRVRQNYMICEFRAADAADIIANHIWLKKFDLGRKG